MNDGPQTAREALAEVLDWWEGLPNDLRQLIEETSAVDDGGEPGCIVTARRICGDLSK